MKLFDSISRDFLGPGDSAEPNFNFLNRTAKPEFQVVRDLLERWFEKYPKSEKEDLRNRFRSKDNSHHTGAFFELYCFSLLRLQGFDVSPHQNVLKSSSKRPDFLVSSNDEPLFIFESTTAPGAFLDPTTEAIFNAFIDKLNTSLNSPNFFISISLKKESRMTPSAKRVCTTLQEKILGLNPDELHQKITDSGHKACPHWHIVDNGWEFEFCPYPKAKENRGKPGVRPIGSQSAGVRWIDSRRPLLNALKSKSSRYGKLDKPYIIAVNSNDLWLEDTDIFDVLFGQEQFSFCLETNDILPSRKPNGLWVGPRGPRNRRVSAILIVSSLKPWTIGVNTPVLWHNPWSERKFDSSVWKGPQMIPNFEKNKMELQTGRNASDIFTLYPKDLLKMKI